MTDQPTGPEFWRLTRKEDPGKTDQGLGLPQPPLEVPCPPDAQVLQLSDPSSLLLPPIDLRTAIEKRTTLRKYSAESLTLQELTLLLWLTQGVKRISTRPATLRTVPSAGSRHPFETYLLVNRVDELKPGLYRYLAIENQLVIMDLSEGLTEKFTYASLQQNQIRIGAVTFYWAADIYRTAWRYHQRAYRYILIDAGHICQNLALAAEAIGAGICPLGSFDDDLINQALGIDGVNMFTAYGATVGKRKKE